MPLLVFVQLRRGLGLPRRRLLGRRLLRWRLLWRRLLRWRLLRRLLRWWRLLWRRRSRWRHEEGRTRAASQEGSTDEVSAPATLIVSLPADARLTVDGQPTRSTSARRVFISPPLQRGQEYAYTLRAEVRGQDGQLVATEQRVTVRAGQETSITLQMPAAAVATSGN